MALGDGVRRARDIERGVQSPAVGDRAPLDGVELRPVEDVGGIPLAQDMAVGDPVPGGAEGQGRIIILMGAHAAEADGIVGRASGETRAVAGRIGEDGARDGVRR